MSTTATKPYVIEISVIAPARDDDDAERIGKAVAELLRHVRAGGNVPRRLRRVVMEVGEVTVANVDGDFLEFVAELPPED